MPEPRLSTTWRVEAEALSPLHVGAGGPRLLADYDFLAHRGEAWVMDLDRVLERVPDDRLSTLGEVRLGTLLRPEDYSACARYRLPLRGPAPGEIVPCVRDVYDRPYLPGSSLKGALRTALARALAVQAGPLDLPSLGDRRQYAARELERRLFGRDPKHDLLRALRVSDAFPAGPANGELAVAAVYSLRGSRLLPKGEGFRWHVEALPVGARLVGSISLDESPKGD